MEATPIRKGDIVLYGRDNDVHWSLINALVPPGGHAPDESTSVRTVEAEVVRVHESGDPHSEVDLRLSHPEGGGDPVQSVPYSSKPRVHAWTHVPDRAAT
jgi:hypothetical protein